MNFRACLVSIITDQLEIHTRNKSKSKQKIRKKEITDIGRWIRALQDQIGGGGGVAALVNELTVDRPGLLPASGWTDRQAGAPDPRPRTAGREGGRRPPCWLGRAPGRHQWVVGRGRSHYLPLCRPRQVLASKRAPPLNSQGRGERMLSQAPGW
jgi:hypothetical protein